MVSKIPHNGLSNSNGRTVKLCSGLSDFLQAQRYGPSNYNHQPSNDNSNQEVNAKLTKEGFDFAQSETLDIPVS